MDMPPAMPMPIADRETCGISARRHSPFVAGDGSRNVGARARPSGSCGSAGQE